MYFPDDSLFTSEEDDDSHSHSSSVESHEDMMSLMDDKKENDTAKMLLKNNWHISLFGEIIQVRARLSAQIETQYCLTLISNTDELECCKTNEQ